MTEFVETETSKKWKKNLPLLLLVLTVFVFAEINSNIHHLESKRWYRDLTGLTPYKDVKVYSQTVSEDGIAITGELTKMRCYFNRLYAYVTFNNGRVKRRVFMLDANGVVMTPVNGSNRPASKVPEAFGPWTISNGGFQPDGWEIYTRHERCESEPHEQDNLFMSGEWKDYHNVELPGEID